MRLAVLDHRSVAALAWLALTVACSEQSLVAASAESAEIVADSTVLQAGPYVCASSALAECAGTLQVWQLGTAQALPLDGTVTVAATQSALVLTFRLRNVSTGAAAAPLQIKSITLDSGNVPVAWQCQSPGGQECTAAAASWPLLWPADSQTTGNAVKESAFSLTYASKAADSTTRVCLRTLGDPAHDTAGFCFFVHYGEPVKAPAPLTECLAIDPSGSNLGQVVLGSEATAVVKVRNCGALPLQWIGLVLAQTVPEQSGAFTIDWAASAALSAAIDPVTGPTALKPVLLGPGAFASLQVRFVAKAAAGIDTATVTALAVAAKATGQLTASGVAGGCPVAKVIIAEGNLAIPQTVLHAKGHKSHALGGKTIAKYLWTAQQPVGSNQPLSPTANFANPTLQANAAGDYLFCLQVWDSAGLKSCQPACEMVSVVPTGALHIELLWDTPSDPVQTDSGPVAGADLDLHFAHPKAATLDLDCDGSLDPWFSNPWDTFWFNAAPQWGAAGVPDDNPTLDLDDTDGAGPENLNLVAPEGTKAAPMVYSVGVHYWNDHGYGKSFATLRVFLFGQLAVQYAKVQLCPLDMWYVGRIHWPFGDAGGGAKFFETCYQSGDSCAAKQNLMWQPNGPFCLTHGYVNKVFVGGLGGPAPQAGNCP
ncbi:MAG: hypothetical protein EXR77_10615 [Myxococcales bacterium]|nr:hypothetical protein [Myxococcales bacterium]